MDEDNEEIMTSEVMTVGALRESIAWLDGAMPVKVVHAGTPAISPLGVRHAHTFPQAEGTTQLMLLLSVY
jgi:hypothetical protein